MFKSIAFMFLIIMTDYMSWYIKSDIFLHLKFGMKIIFDHFYNNEIHHEN